MDERKGEIIDYMLAIQFGFTPIKDTSLSMLDYIEEADWFWQLDSDERICVIEQDIAQMLIGRIG
jgi:hypothetical protein